MKVHANVTPWELAQALARAGADQADVRQEIEALLDTLSGQADIHQSLALQVSLSVMLLCRTVRVLDQLTIKQSPALRAGVAARSGV